MSSDLKAKNLEFINYDQNKNYSYITPVSWFDLDSISD